MDLSASKVPFDVINGESDVIKRICDVINGGSDVITANCDEINRKSDVIPTSTLLKKSIEYTIDAFTAPYLHTSLILL